MISSFELDENMEFGFSTTWLTIIRCILLSGVVPNEYFAFLRGEVVNWNE